MYVYVGAYTRLRAIASVRVFNVRVCVSVHTYMRVHVRVRVQNLFWQSTVQIRAM